MGKMNKSDLSAVAQAGWQTLVEEFAAYLSAIGRSPLSVQGHRECLKYWRKYAAECGIESPEQVTPQIVAGYQAWIYARRTRFGKPFALTSQIVILNSLQVFYRFLVRSGKVLNNPTLALRLPKEPKKLPGTILTPKEVRKLLSQPDTSTVLGFRDITMYELLYSSGLRITELIRLKVGDIDFSEGSYGKQATVFIQDGKGGKDRVVPLGATARRYLNEYLQRVRPILLRVSVPSVVDVLFLNRLGKPFDKSGLLKKLHIHAARAGIEKSKTPTHSGRITVHTFRHTLATEMLRHGADLRQIQELLGHEKLSTTQLYTHVVKGELKRIQEQCHPREQVDLPVGFVRYRGRKYLTEADVTKEKRTSKRMPTDQ